MWTRANVGEVLPDVVSPLTWSIVNQVLKLMMRASFGRLGVDFEPYPIVTRIAGRGYFNVNVFVAFLRKFPGMRRVDVTEIFGGEQDRVLAASDIRLSGEDLPDLKFSLAGVLWRMPGFVVWILCHTRRRNERFLEELRRRIDEERREDLAAMSDDDLLARLRVFHTEGFEHVGSIVAVAASVAYYNRLRRLCRVEFGDEHDATTNRLMAGVGKMDSAEAPLDLWRMAAFAHARPELEQALLGGAKPEDTAALPGGAKFLAQWYDFMERHGHHGRGEIELLNPRWRETPEDLLVTLRTYLGGLGTTDPLADQCRRAAEREALTVECRRRLRNPLKRAFFNFLLRGAQQGLTFRENFKSQAVRLIAEMRRAALELGARLARRGALAQPEDIFFLFLDEIPPLLTASPALNLIPVVQQRRREHERWARIMPPPVVVGGFDPDTYVAEEVETGARVLSGVAVGAGTATGPARIILRADSLERVLPGEILVAPFTDPGWTPYFLPAAGIVVDMGGLLSHGSIVARELGLPAVVNVGPATRIIRTGQRIKVDGDRGEVTILG